MENISNLSKKTLIPIAVVGALVAVYKYIQSRRTCMRNRRSREIIVINTADQWDEVYPRLCQQCEIIKAVGLDCEWVFGGHRYPVSLLQISTHEGLCLLVRLCLLKNNIPNSLKIFLADKRILKLGVAVRDDGRKLLKDYGMAVHGCVDLRHLAARIRGLAIRQESLQGLAETVLQVKMKKDKAIRCGDWQAETLSDAQIDYAADDALIAIDVFMQLVTYKVEGMVRRQQFYGYSVSSDPATFWKSASSLCQGVVDIPYKQPKFVTQGSVDHEDFGWEEMGPIEDDEESAANGDPKKMRVRIKDGKKAFMTRQRPLYYNCVIEAPDGKSLTTCDKRKAEWYLLKGLAEKVGDEPLRVRLNFEPSRRPTSDQDYYLQNKENVCVVCGKDKDYVRKIIVPQEYRKYFPTVLKDHSSHDVLLLCINCHLQSALYDDALKHQLAVECDAPLESGRSTRAYLNHDLSKVVSAARALLRHRDNDRIPESRIVELEALVKNFYGVSALTEELLNEAANIDYKQQNPDFVPHGKKVVEHYMAKEGGLLGFEKMWRQQFVNMMEPKFLPAMWSIDHRPERMTNLQ